MWIMKNKRLCKLNLINKCPAISWGERWEKSRKNVNLLDNGKYLFPSIKEKTEKFGLCDV